MIIPLLRDDKTGLAMDDSGVSWFGALLPAGSIVGSFIPGKYVFDSLLDDFNLENYEHMAFKKQMLQPWCSGATDASAPSWPSLSFKSSLLS